MNQFGADFHHHPADFDKHQICKYINNNFQVLKTLIDKLTKLIKDANPLAGGQSLYD